MIQIPIKPINSGEFGLKIATSGRFLGGVVGVRASMESFVKKEVLEWRMNLQQLLLAASTQFQAAYGAFTKSLQSEWIFLQSVNCVRLWMDLFSSSGYNP